jgi:YidC/Oxa1 family membrane protein insertase
MDQKNLILAIAASLVIVLGFQFLPGLLGFAPDPPAIDLAAEDASTPGASGTVRPQAPGGVPAASGTAPAAGAAESIAESREEVILDTPRVIIDSPRLSGSIAIQGGRLDDLILPDYRHTTNPDSPAIVLLSPAGTPNAYFAEVGWTPARGSDVVVPGPNTPWRADGRTLRPDTPVTLTWDNGAGLRFSRIYEIDRDYMFHVTQRVENTGTVTATLFPYALISRWDTPTISGFYILHEGPIGAFQDVLEEEDYDDVKDDGPFTYEGKGGWIGITDKYWLVALIPDSEATVRAQFLYTGDGKADKYQADFTGQDATILGPGAVAEVTSRIFAGAKEVKLLDDYAELYGISRFDRAVGFRWLYFLAKPLFYLLDFFYEQVGNFGVAILLLTVLIKILFFPLANKSYRAMGRMKALQPKMTALREQFGDDKQKLHQEMMELYKREKANPMAGCWPMLIQIPVFFCLYQVLFVTIEMRHAPFFGWIVDLSAPDPTTIFNLFGLIPFQPPEMLSIGIWPLLMGVSMFLQQKINPQPPDPMQARIMMMLPIVFTFILANFPSGLVIYWAWNNTLSIAQQWVIMKRAMAVGAPGATAPRSAAGGVKALTTGLLARVRGQPVEAEAPPPPAAPKPKPKKAEKAAEPDADKDTVRPPPRNRQRRKRKRR